MPLSLLMTAGLSFLLYVSGFFVIFTPLPLALGCLRRGFLNGLVSFLLSLTLLVMLYRFLPMSFSFLPLAALESQIGPARVMVLSLIYFFYFGWMGFLVAFVSKKSWKQEKSFLIILLATLLVPMALLLGYAYTTGWFFLQDLRSAIRFLMNRMIALQSQSGMGGEEVSFLKQYADQIVVQVLGMLPAFWINFMLMTLSLNILFLRRFMGALTAKPFSSWVEFPSWRLEETWIWIPITAGAFYFANMYGIHDQRLSLVLINILLVMVGIYFLHGLAITNFYLKKTLSPMLRLSAYFLIFLFAQVIGVFIVALGVFDFWFDFRKLKKVA